MGEGLFIHRGIEMEEEVEEVVEGMEEEEEVVVVDIMRIHQSSLHSTTHSLPSVPLSLLLISLTMQPIPLPPLPLLLECLFILHNPP